MTLPINNLGFMPPYNPVFISHTSQPDIPNYRAFIEPGMIDFLRVYKSHMGYKPHFEITLYNRNQIVRQESISLFAKDNILYFLPYEFVAFRDCWISHIAIEFEGVPAMRFCFDHSVRGKPGEYWPSIYMKKGESLSTDKISFRI